MLVLQSQVSSIVLQSQVSSIVLQSQVSLTVLQSQAFLTLRHFVFSSDIRFLLNDAAVTNGFGLHIAWSFASSSHSSGLYVVNQFSYMSFSKSCPVFMWHN